MLENGKIVRRHTDHVKSHLVVNEDLPTSESVLLPKERSNEMHDNNVSGSPLEPSLPN